MTPPIQTIITPICRGGVVIGSIHKLLGQAAWEAYIGPRWRGLVMDTEPTTFVGPTGRRDAVKFVLDNAPTTD